MLRSTAAARLTTLALFLALTACERSSTAPTNTPAPDPSMASAAVEVGAPRHAGGVVSATIDEHGGSLRFTDAAVHDLTFRLDVPAGAVRQATMFRMIVPAAATYAVNLSATRGNNDVGQNGFQLPVRLTISYRSANYFNRDPSHLGIAWLPGYGHAPEPVITVLDVSRKEATGYLPHFSKWSLVMW